MRKELESRSLSSKGLKSQLIARLTKQLKVEEQVEESKEPEKPEPPSVEEDESCRPEDDREVRKDRRILLLQRRLSDKSHTNVGKNLPFRKRNESGRRSRNASAGRDAMFCQMSPPLLSIPTGLPRTANLTAASCP